MNRLPAFLLVLLPGAVSAQQGTVRYDHAVQYDFEAPSDAEPQVISELDAYWAELSRTVEEGDFEGYSRLYHPDAVLVSLGSESSYPIAQALEGWEQGFLDTRAGRVRASVAFRFTQRLHDETTAHEAGIFRYTLEQGDGSQTVAMLHFEALLVRKDGAWLMVMEYQKHPATAEDWQAAEAVGRLDG
jgi:ketosteroid isomerase-like protein